MQVKRTGILFKPNVNRVILQPFFPTNEERAGKIIRRILSLPKEQIRNQLQKVLKEFEHRHRNLRLFYLRRFEELPSYLLPKQELDDDQKLLIGAYFTMEYSVESAALFNPSMVWHPEQSGQKKDDKRFIISFRSTGEGHISSITFRSGTIDRDNNINLTKPGRYVSSPEIKKLGSGYQAVFNPDMPLSERILFPSIPAERNGMEDARFVKFNNQDGSTQYYATYTAYDGKHIHTMLLETKDFLQFTINHLQGSVIENKGFALFPRKVNGHYVMLSRQDNENIYIMFSKNLHHWNSKTILTQPRFPWEYFQIGNCGSPIETGAGWLVLSHAVGPMRKYVLSAFLLDLNDPSRVLNRLKQPLLQSNETERQGYVPNVVYSCGSVIHNQTLVIPYAMSDMNSGFLFVPLDELLEKLKNA